MPRPEPMLIYVKDRWGYRVRVDANELKNRKRKGLRIYNQYGQPVVSTVSIILRENIQGEPEYERSTAVLDLMMDGLDLEAAVKVVTAEVERAYLSIRRANPDWTAESAYRAAQVGLKYTKLSVTG